MADIHKAHQRAKLSGMAPAPRVARWSLLAALMASAACSVVAPRPAKTALMQKLEADGAGDLSEPTLSKEALYAWLRKRPAPYNKELQEMCSEMTGRGVTAQWYDSVDGKICAAARAIILPPERQYDDTTFRGGNR